MNTKKTADDSDDLLCAATIMQGLLASGHYTTAQWDDGSDEPMIRKFDHGERWEGDGFSRRFESFVIGDALSLLEELKQRIEHDSL